MPLGEAWPYDGRPTMARPRVVLADDHPRIAAELSAVLAAEFDVVDVVANGRSLLDSVRRERPDAVVTDIAMSGMTGLVAADAILAKTPDARIVFVTVHDERALIEHALDGGVLAYVLKCDAGDELIEAVRAALAGEEYVSKTARVAIEKGDAGPRRRR